jgi:hypothetical protein
MYLKRTIERSGGGRLYLLRFALKQGFIVHKIGICYSDRSTDRMMEILRSWFMVYRYVPETYLRLDYSTGVPVLLEKYLHSYFKEYKWEPDKKVQGSTEMFKGLDEDFVIEYIKNFNYELLLQTKEPISTEDYKWIDDKISEPINLNEDIPF